jgi:hypothetical protein
MLYSVPKDVLRPDSSKKRRVSTNQKACEERLCSLVLCFRNGISDNGQAFHALTAVAARSSAAWLLSLFQHAENL